MRMSAAPAGYPVDGPGQGYRHGLSDMWDGYAALLRWVAGVPEEYVGIPIDGATPWVPLVFEKMPARQAAQRALARRLGAGVEIRRTRDGGLEARWSPASEASGIERES